MPLWKIAKIIELMVLKTSSLDPPRDKLECVLGFHFHSIFFPYLRLATLRHLVATTQGRMPRRKIGKKKMARPRQMARATRAATSARGTTRRARGISRM